MRKFQIIPISHSLKGNKIAKSGEIVSEIQLTSPADELVSAGFLKEVFEDVNDIEVTEVIPAETEEKEVFEDVKKEIKDIKKTFNKK
jgi:hypothetical protein